MKQIGQKLKSGEMRIIETPIPKTSKGYLLVQCQYSLISAGTESSNVETARKGYIGKAKERPQQVKQVLDTLKSQGPIQTYRAVMKKLDAYSPLGYSCAGKVIEIGDGTKGYKVGDMVACGGFTASHSEFVAVPSNLCVRLDHDADLKQAVYNTLGAIALQGVRQADLRIGETCAVIGLGLLGQLTALILKASGIKTIGIDINPKMVDIAKSSCVDLGLTMDAPGIEEQCNQFTDGLGCDAVIITAASNSLQPVNFAGAISRKKGKVVVVGAVPTGFDREPHYYKKELQLKMSCSYGPGRYDPVYEDKGIDYPAAYVRWTEQRNMAAFQYLLSSGQIDVSYLTTHCFKLKDAADAYNMILEKSEHSIGILIEYDHEDFDGLLKRMIVLNLDGKHTAKRIKKIGVGFIGAGSYAMNHLVPNMVKNSDVDLKGVMTVSGHSARSVAERAGFDYATTDENEILNDQKINTVFIATRHNTHFEYVLKALKKEKNVFVEKPLCMNLDQLNEIIDVVNTAGHGEKMAPRLMVGYNRRFSPAAISLKKQMPNGPMAITYRVNAGFIPNDSWIQDDEIGGGRIIGEVCHFVDFITFLTGSRIRNVHAASMTDPNGNDDTLTATLTYENGSIGVINYFANGDKAVPKEFIEVFSSGCVGTINDFRGTELYLNGKKKTKSGLIQNKGQKVEIERFIHSIKNTGLSPIAIDELINTSLATFAIIESLKTGMTVQI